MSAYRKILVAVDGSPASSKGLREAIRLAQAEGARLFIVHVVDEYPAFATWIVPVEGGATRKIELNDPWARQVRVHPDGKRIVFWIPNNTPEQVWVVENVRSKSPSTFKQ